VTKVVVNGPDDLAMSLVKGTIVPGLGGGVRPGAFGHGRRLLGLVPIEDALGAVELAGHVIDVVVDLPGHAPQRVVGDVRSKHARLDAGGPSTWPKPSQPAMSLKTCGPTPSWKNSTSSP
jgi:hypothetical protein